MPKKPNIVFLLNDHQAYYRHGWDGGPRIQRPHFERLAASGVAFSRAYTACALCGPARRTMLTGLYPHNHGEIKNDFDHPWDREDYLRVLAANGYRNFYYGKWHAGSGTALEHDCEGFSYPSYNNPYTKTEYKAYLREQGLPDPEILLKQSFQPDTWGPRQALEAAIRQETPYKQESDWCNEHAAGIMTTPKETQECFFLAHLACEKLRQIAKDDQPFHLRVDFWGPHQPYFPCREYADMYPPADIPVYPSFDDDLSDKPEIYRREYNRGLHIDHKIIHPNPRPWRDWQETMALCYAQISMIDEAGGRVIDTLRELGLDRNTLIVWSTDHGDGLACHGGHFDKSSYMAEELVRIPMVVSFPGVAPPNQKREELVSNIDLAPTFLDAAGAEFQEPVDGSSLLPLLRGATTAWREDLMCETHGHGEDHIGRLVVADRYKYVANKGDLDELYDLADDPYELTNLVSNPAFAAVLANMKKRLSEWQDRTNDGEAELT